MQINIVNLRKFALNDYGTVDDRPFGGGPGMILRVDVVDKALQSLKNTGVKTLLSPKGKQFTQQKAERYSKLECLTLICGHYEGFDQRIHEHLVDEEISVGPYILTGGEIPAMVVVDATARLVTGVIRRESLQEESFSKKQEASSQEPAASSYLEYPQYTKPREYKGWNVPEVLLSGNHEAISNWRHSSSSKSPSSS